MLSAIFCRGLRVSTSTASAVLSAAAKLRTCAGGMLYWNATVSVSLRDIRRVCYVSCRLSSRFSWRLVAKFVGSSAHDRRPHFRPLVHRFLWKDVYVARVNYFGSVPFIRLVSAVLSAVCSGLVSAILSALLSGFVSAVWSAPCLLRLTSAVFLVLASAILSRPSCRLRACCVSCRLSCWPSSGA